MTWRILKYLQHLFYIRHRKGRGIHSPSLFEVVHDVIFNRRGILVPENITAVYRELRKDRTLISSGQFGPGSAVSRSGLRSVASFVRGSSVSPKYGSLLYRISGWFRPEIIIELGTGLGVSTVYLSAGSPGIPLKTIEGNAERAIFAEGVIKRCGLQNVKVHVGDMDHELKKILEEAGAGQFSADRGLRLLAFLDGNHRVEPTISYMRELISASGEEGVILLDDIYWSKGMSSAWKEIISWPGVRVSIDLFRMGILLLRKDLNKENVKIKF